MNAGSPGAVLVAGGPRLLAGSAVEHAHTLFVVETAALWSGPQKRLFRLARAWAARGHPSVVAALRGDEHSEQRALEHYGLPVFVLTPGGKEVLKSYRPGGALAVRRLVQRLRPSLVFTMETLVDYHVRLGLLGRRLPVVTLLGIDRWKWEEKVHRRLAMRWLAAGPGAVVANSPRGLEGWRRVVGAVRFERRPHTVIPNPVVSDEFQPRFERTGGADDLVVGGLGRFQHQKGFDLLVEALATLPEVIGGRRVVLRLQGRGRDEGALRARAVELGLGERFELRPFTPEVQPFLHSLDLLVVPSRWSGFENVALEGILCGTPVLCSSRAGLDALWHDPAFVPFEPAVEPLGRTLRACLERSPDERSALARAQHARVVAELDAPHIAERFEAFLASAGLVGA